jgi:hypothetical protein
LRLLFCFLLILVLPSKSFAEKYYEDNLGILLRGDISGLINSIESEKDFDWDKNQIKLSKKNSWIYGTALIANGDLLKAEKFLSEAIKNYPKETKIKNLYKQISLYKLNYSNPFIELDLEEKSHLKIIELFPEYLESKSFGHEEKAQELKTKLLELINLTSNRKAYFPSRLEYLIEFGVEDTGLLAKKEALEIIENYDKILFPKTLDNYEIAVAYRVLGRLDKSYFYASKMRSIWLVEDLRLWDKIWKITKRSTKVEAVLPQWIVSVQERFKPL